MSIKKRNKKISIIIVGCATVAVASVGFSSWVIGLIQPEVDLSVTNVTVDGTKDETKYINIVIKPDDVLKIGEITSSTKEDSGEIFVENGMSDLEIEITNFEIAYNKNNSFEKVDFVLSVNENGSMSYTAKIDDAFGRSSGSDYTYLEINWNSSITSLTDFDLATIGNYYLYTPNSESIYNSLKFTWGSLFGYKSPTIYYQNKFDSATSVQEKLKMLTQMENELTQMKSDLGGKTITLKAILSIK